MALLATQFTVEILLWIGALYLGFDSGLIRKLSAIGFSTIGLSLSLQSQSYVSDVSTTPLNVFLAFTGPIQNALALLFTLTFLSITATIFVDLRIIMLEKDEKKRLEMLA